VLRRANPENRAQPAPEADEAAAGLRHALIGVSLVVAWLVLCLVLWKVF
jgi:hypothetical protein